MADSTNATQNMSVLNPVGYPPKVTPKALAPRLDSSTARRSIWSICRFDDSDIFLRQMQAWFAEQHARRQTMFKQISSVYTKDDPQTWEEIKAEGDAAIVGVGH